MEMPVSRDAAAVAREKYGVDLANDREVLAKMRALQIDAKAVAELSNLWGEYQDRKKQAA